jgi:hypothetical protein
MKYLILSVALFIFLLAKTQNINYLENNPIWRVSQAWGANAPCIEFWDYIHYIDHDTLVGNTVYSLVKVKGTVSQSWYGPPPSMNCEGSYTFDYAGVWVRQENKKIFALENPSTQQEVLLYDFDLAIGDTLPHTSVFSIDNCVVTAIDSIWVAGAYRKKFLLSESIWPGGFLIEGLGFGGGFIDPCPFYQEFPTELLCFVVNDTTYYPALGSYCETNVSVSARKKQPDFQVFPNPVVGQLTLVSSQGHSIDQIMVHNSQGNTFIPKIEVFDQTTLRLDFSRLQPGIYLLRMFNQGMPVYHCKTIKR